VNKLRDGRYIAVVHQPMPAGGWVALHQDITEQKRAEEQIAHLAHHDGLTDLPNRVLLSERLEAALSRLRSDECLAVHYLDLDLFKNVNDTLGHAVGDELLRAVAERLQSLVRESDIIARLGGDEFAIVQTGLRRDADAAMLAQRIRNGFQSPYALKEHQIVTDVSIGIAVAPADGEDADKLLRHADLALYAAKADGRATHRFFEPQMDGRLKERRAVEVALRGAGEWRVRAPLSAGREPCARRNQWLRGTAALAASPTRHDPAFGIYSCGGGDGAHQSDRRMGAQNGLCRRCGVARRSEGYLFSRPREPQDLAQWMGSRCLGLEKVA
jgi:diguanylate cyclase (GGDEF)-like protein